MLNVDGLITGLDTTSIIEGLLSVQQSRIDRLNARKQKVAEKQAAFKSIEANLLGLRGSLGRLNRTTDSAFSSHVARSSDEDRVIASAAEPSGEPAPEEIPCQ